MAKYSKRQVSEPIEAFLFIKGVVWPIWFNEALTAGRVTLVRPLGVSVDFDAAMLPSNHGSVKASLGDWIIKRNDGEMYPCKPDVFEASYIEVGADEIGLNFGDVIAGLKIGKRYARANWNGKGMFVFLVEGSKFVVNREPLRSIMGEGSEVNYHAHIDMKTVDGTIVPWVASQSDMLAEDWVRV